MESIKSIESELNEHELLHYKLPAQPYPRDVNLLPGPLQLMLGQVHLPPSMVNPESYSYDLNQVTNLKQRLAHPAIQPTLTKKLLPRRKNLLTKIAHRCMKCTRFVIKPSALANSISFEFRRLAVLIVPKISIGEFPPLKKDVPTKLIVYFKSPLLAVVKLSLSEVPPSAFTSPPTSKVSFPTAETTINEYDDIAEQDEMLADDKKSQTPQNEADNPHIVAFRHLSKVGLFFEVTPLADNAPITFSMVVTVEASAPDVDFKKFSFVTHISLGMTSNALPTNALTAVTTNTNTNTQTI